MVATEVKEPQGIISFRQIDDMRTGVPIPLDVKLIGANYWFIHRLMEYHPATDGNNAFLIAEYDYTGQEHWAQDHFPGNPMMPANLQIEACDQATALLGTFNEKLRDRYFVKIGMDGVRFRDQVRPGQILVIETRIIKADDRAGKATYRAWVKDRPDRNVLEVKVLIFFAPKNAARAQAAGLTA